MCLKQSCLESTEEKISLTNNQNKFYYRYYFPFLGSRDLDLGFHVLIQAPRKAAVKGEEPRLRGQMGQVQSLALALGTSLNFCPQFPPQ